MKIDISGKSFNEIGDLIDELIFDCRADEDSFHIERWGSRAYLGWD